MKIMLSVVAVILLLCTFLKAGAIRYAGRKTANGAKAVGRATSKGAVKVGHGAKRVWKAVW
jgi:hypothetical protein